MLIWRLLKYIALMLIAVGTTGAFAGRAPAERQRFVYLVATAGLALMWVSGFGLLRTAGYSMRAPFIGGGVALSLVWFYVLVRAVEDPEPRGPMWIGAAALPLLGALALMVFRPG